MHAHTQTCDQQTPQACQWTLKYRRRINTHERMLNARQTRIRVSLAIL